MKTVFRIILAITSLLAVQQVVAQIVFYEQEGFRGRTFAANGTVNNLDGTGFNDRASSAIVQGGEWQICDDAYFRGRCLILRPGQYGSLGAMDMNNRVSSVRPVGGRPQYSYAPPPPP